jgi:predicted ATP-dependent serine protease
MQTLSQKHIDAAIKKLENYTPERIPEGAWGVAPQHTHWYIGTPKKFITMDCIPYYKKIKTTKKTNEPMQKTNSFSAMSLVKSLNDFDFDPKLFIPHRAKTLLDGVWSEGNGLLPACNYIVIGDPGAGKTTLMADYIGRLMMENKTALFVSAEMSPRDLKQYGDRMPHIANIPTIFFSEIFAADDEPNLWQIFEELFMSGQDVILLDSLAEVIEPIREQMKWSYAMAERKFVDLMLQANREHMTSFLIIQQVTKGGKFVGTNKLKHNTTGMIEIRNTGAKGEISDVRKVIVAKNRSGFVYSSLDFSFVDGAVEFDEKALLRHMKAKELNGTEDFNLDDFFSDDEAVFEKETVETEN